MAGQTHTAFAGGAPMQPPAAGAAPEGMHLPFANEGKSRKSKMPLISSDECWRQYQEKLEAERMSDEEFAELWRGLRADAVKADRVRAEPYDLERAERAGDEPVEGVEPVENDPLDPDFEYMTDDGKTIDGIDAIRARDMARAELEAEQEAQPPADERTFDEKVDHLMGVVTRTSRYREILRKTLVYCRTRRPLPEVEDRIQEYPEYPYAAQNPYRLIRFLVDADGIDLLEIDEEGAVVTPDRKVGLTEDEIDDLIVEFQLETTDVGDEVARRLEPNLRIADLLRQMPVRFDSYKKVMEFCREPHGIKEINALFEDVDLKALGTMNSDDSIPIQPSVFVDKLERAGAMYWDGKWKLTASGKTFIDTIENFEL